MIDTSFLKELEKFSLIVNKRVTSKYSGERKSAYSGAGTIFRDRRMYTLGDNYKNIDWNVYARTDDLYVKVYEEERNLEVHVLIDSSASMHYKDKFEYASKIGLGAAYLGVKNNERVHFATFATKVELFRGRKGRSQIAAMMDHLNNAEPADQTDLYGSLRKYKPKVNSKSYIVIISDFLHNPEELENALSLFFKGHTIRLVQVLHEDEDIMPLEGDYKLIDAESKQVLKSFVSKRTQSIYLENLESHKSELQRIADQHGAHFLSVNTETPLFDSFFELAKTA